jgi:hypothetical protein
VNERRNPTLYAFSQFLRCDFYMHGQSVSRFNGWVYRAFAKSAKDGHPALSDNPVWYLVRPKQLQSRLRARMNAQPAGFKTKQVHVQVIVQEPS